MNGPLCSLIRAVGTAFCIILASSCASPLATSARQDDLKAFQTKLRQAEKPLSDSALVEVARAVAERELLSMPNDTAVSRVTELRTCAPELQSTFRELGERQDVVGALATQVLLDEGLWQGDRSGLVLQYAASDSPEWRAVAARSATAAEHAEFRRKAFLDGDLRVRRAALRAARDARSSDDQEALLEASRLDPDPIARKFALEALSITAEADVLAGLRDAWPRADESVRREFVFAWGRKHALSNGGGTHLAWVVSTQTGIPRLAAAVVLLGQGVESNRSFDLNDPDAALAEAALVQGFTQGAADEQQFVARYAPRTPRLVKAFADGLKSPDEQTAVSAASVLIRGTTFRQPAHERLKALLASKAPQVAAQAFDALATVRSPKIATALRKQLQSPDPSLRIAAATQLLPYHLAGQSDLGFEVLMADPDASVRTTVACEVISQLGH